ncbi:HAD family hydrolase [Domibacillus indicus]
MKLIAIDMDGTLLNSKNKISPENIQVSNRVHKSSCLIQEIIFEIMSRK